MQLKAIVPALWFGWQGPLKKLWHLMAQARKYSFLLWTFGTYAFIIRELMNTVNYYLYFLLLTLLHVFCDTASMHMPLIKFATLINWYRVWTHLICLFYFYSFISVVLCLIRVAYWHFTFYRLLCWYCWNFLYVALFSVRVNWSYISLYPT